MCWDGIGDIEPGACEFEHVLAPELVDSICTLLDIPRMSPRRENSGRECCRQRSPPFPALSGRCRRAGWEEVKVAYVNTRSNSRMHKLSHFGIIPGARVSVHQRYPSFVIVCAAIKLRLRRKLPGDLCVANGTTRSPY